MSFPELGQSYSRVKISAELGGNIRSSLPESNGIVVCGCFNTAHRWNPGAPEEVTLGTKQRVRTAARKLKEQSAIIPIFLFTETSKWEYIGDYLCMEYTEDKELCDQKIKENPERGPIGGVLYFERAFGSIVHSERLSQHGGVLPAVRILPMSLGEFEDEGYQNVDDLQQKYFMSELPFKQGGCYNYKTKGLIADPGTVVLFQCDGLIIASASFNYRKEFLQPYMGRYSGGLYFDVNSIRVFNPVDAGGIKNFWPTFKRFGNVTQKLNINSYSSFEQSLAGVETPQMWLRAEEADSTTCLSDNEVYVPQGYNRRLVVERQIRERRGQGVFRDDLRKLYGDRCLVTGCEELAVLEAAHISPYRGEEDNHPGNGLLLRSDIHTLFDLDLLGIEPESLRVELHPDACKEYGQFVGKTLACIVINRPSRKALQQRYELFKKRRGIN